MFILDQRNPTYVDRVNKGCETNNKHNMHAKGKSTVVLPNYSNRYAWANSVDPDHTAPLDQTASRSSLIWLVWSLIAHSTLFRSCQASQFTKPHFS